MKEILASPPVPEKTISSAPLPKFEPTQEIDKVASTAAQPIQEVHAIDIEAIHTSEVEAQLRALSGAVHAVTSSFRQLAEIPAITSTLASVMNMREHQVAQARSEAEGRIKIEELKLKQDHEREMQRMALANRILLSGGVLGSLVAAGLVLSVRTNVLNPGQAVTAGLMLIGFTIALRQLVSWP